MIDKTKEALALVVELGCDIVKNDYHLYREPDGKYLVLTFSKINKVWKPEEEVFDDINDAVGKFLVRTKS